MFDPIRLIIKLSIKTVKKIIKYIKYKYKSKKVNSTFYDIDLNF